MQAIRRRRSLGRPDYERLLEGDGNVEGSVGDRIAHRQIQSAQSNMGPAGMRLVLDTPRLSLRHLKPGDAGFLVELMNEPPYIANIGDRGVRTVPDAVKYIEEKYTTSYARHGFGLYLVELTGETAPIGICGLVKRDLLDRPDLGFAYLQRFWSMGYATEAASATLRYARESLMLPYIYGLVSPKNSRSINLLERLGFRFVRSFEVAGQLTASHLYGTELKPS